MNNNSAVYEMHEIILVLIAFTLIGLVYLFAYLVDIDQPARAFTVFGVFIFFSRVAVLFWTVNEDSGVLSKTENLGITNFIRGDLAFVLSLLPLMLSLYVQMLEYSTLGRWLKLQWVRWQRKRRIIKQ